MTQEVMVMYLAGFLDSLTETTGFGGPSSKLLAFRSILDLASSGTADMRFPLRGFIHCRKLHT